LRTQPKSWSPFNLIVTTRFRELVDDWLATGVDADRSESSAKRNLSAAHIATEAVVGSTRRKQVELSIDSTGELAILVMAEPGEEAFTSYNYCRAAFRKADALFRAMMAVDWKRRLFKCRRSNCGQYFVVEKLLRRPYRHGVFCCHEHRRSESAANCTNSRRELAKSGLVKCAAEWLLNQRGSGEAWQESKHVKLRLASFLSAKISREPNLRAAGQRVGVKWVTRHAPEIERRRLDDAKMRLE
jgi:hypothetical protein